MPDPPPLRKPSPALIYRMQQRAGNRAVFALLRPPKLAAPPPPEPPPVTLPAPPPKHVNPLVVPIGLILVGVLLGLALDWIWSARVPALASLLCSTASGLVAVLYLNRRFHSGSEL